MNAASNPRSLSPRRIGLALVAFAVATCFADEARDPQEGASLTKQLPALSTESSGTTECDASQGPANTIRLAGAHGETLQLAYFAGCGWKYIAAHRNVSPVSILKVGYRPAGAPQDEGSILPEDPTTVFIDGPTGYTFAWTPAGGWKFVGQLRP
ncbi:MAG TPA: hypothetical protein VK864_15340 [Longimicrobiales bacterium]|nr:hypothetical protein [Longimicrobiales bacterium]